MESKKTMQPIDANNLQRFLGAGLTAEEAHRAFGRIKGLSLIKVSTRAQED